MLICICAGFCTCIGLNVYIYILMNSGLNENAMHVYVFLDISECLSVRANMFV